MAQNFDTCQKNKTKLTINKSIPGYWTQVRPRLIRRLSDRGGKEDHRRHPQHPQNEDSQRPGAPGSPGAPAPSQRHAIIGKIHHQWRVYFTRV